MDAIPDPLFNWLRGKRTQWHPGWTLSFWCPLGWQSSSAHEPLDPDHVHCRDQHLSCWNGMLSEAPAGTTFYSFLSPFLRKQSSHWVNLYSNRNKILNGTENSCYLIFIWCLEIFLPVQLFLWQHLPEPQYFLYTENLGRVCRGERILVPLIFTRHRLIKTIPTQGVGGASVLFAQFKSFIINFRSSAEFGGACGSFINSQHKLSLMYRGLDQPQRAPVGRAGLLPVLSRGSQAGLQITKI